MAHLYNFTASFLKIVRKWRAAQGDPCILIHFSRPKGATGTKRKVKDPNKPKRSTSAYFFFLAKCREDAKKEGRSISRIAEFTKEVSAKWGKMSDDQKSPFNKQAQADKERYEAEMAIYKGKSPADANKPKRPQSAYFCFLADFRVRMREKNIDHKEIIKMAGEAWRTLGDEEKKPFEKQALEEQKKYEAALKEWRENGGNPVSPKKAKTSNGTEEEEEDDDDEEDEEDDDEDDE
ncbi:hypothetical protein FSP39_012087 [Pinctada imbricata]|uniref:HMG box domain-containing protein n=1 Tax=Pinctada imbricata TaxID=66713 RepID=A0AA88YMJ3_PINIB|nr:hypothetical protein FSP39_012087 [Pinctada imbricata]